MAESILEVKNLEIRYVTDEETVSAVNGVSFTLEKGESIGLVGCAGAGWATPAPATPPRPWASWAWCRTRRGRC